MPFLTIGAKSYTQSNTGSLSIIPTQYDIVPPWHTLTNQLSLSGKSYTGLFNSIDLVSFSNWHLANASNYYTSNITNRYLYTFDLLNSYTINDGGLDMWDGGNQISLSGFATSNNINYGTLSNNTVSKFGFFISQSNVWPQISLGYTASGTVGWKNGGNLGSDGAGSFSNFSGSYTTTNQGRYGTFWVNENYAATDPTICYVWFTILQPSVNSGITSSNDLRKLSVANDYTQSFSVTGSNYLFGQFLLSRTSGAFIPSVDIQSFLTAYVQNANIIIN